MGLRKDKDLSKMYTHLVTGGDQPPVYIVQECGLISMWKKFILWKKMETLLCKRAIFAKYLEIYLLKIVSYILFATF